MTPTNLPLKSLKLSPANARQDPGDVRSLAHSIHTIGLVSALAVTKNGRGYLVEAGGRRLAALQQLLKDGHISASYPVPCLLFDTPDLARSLAENTERKAMDPVQEFQAFGRLLGEGRTVHDIAEAFSVTPQYVRQRAKLADLDPNAINAYRQGRCSLEALQALTYGTPEQQRAIVSQDPIPHAYHIRERLRGQVVDQDDKRARLVGLDAYTAAGGRTIEDLFASTIQLLDVDLLDRLAGERLQPYSDQALADGAAWVEIVESPYTEDVRRRFDDAHKEFRPTPEQAAELAGIRERMVQLVASEKQSDELDNTYASLFDRANEIEEAATVTNDRRPVGKLIWLAADGTISCKDAVRKADKPTQPDGQNTADSPDSTPPAKPLTQKNILQVAQVREAVIADALRSGKGQHAAIALVAMMFDHDIIASRSYDQPRRLPLINSLSRSTSERPEDIHGPMVESVEAELAKRRQGVTRTMPGFAWYFEQDTFDLLAIISDGIALAIVDPQACTAAGSYNSAPSTSIETIKALLTATGVNLADYWSPDAQWLRSYGKANVLAALESVGHPTEGLDKAKLADLASQAATVLGNKGWVPGEMAA